jgi:hypothetical protein
MSAMLNIYNARAFLAEGKFVPSGEAYAKDPTREGGPAGLVAFERSALRAPPLPTYQVTDAVPPPRSPDWARVVAVVVQGKAWQFRDWPFKGAAQSGEFSFLLFSPLSVLRVRFFPVLVASLFVSFGASVCRRRVRGDAGVCVRREGCFPRS